MANCPSPSSKSTPRHELLNPLHVASVLKELTSKAAEKIAAHDKKCSDVLTKLNEESDAVDAVKKHKKWLNISEYERKVAVLKPLQDKARELLLQRREFDGQLEALKNDLKSENVSRTKSDLRRVQVSFEQEMDQFASALPMYARKTEITETVLGNQVCIVLGETGSGKSTQILQYLYAAGLGNNKTIVCTQPRKMAAISLAKRVAEEMRYNVGELVGYRVGMQSKQSRLTQLLYVTDHVLLNDCLKNPLFDSYSCIVVDEAHERSIFSDLLLGFIKRCLLERPDLRVVIMSATIDPGLFVSYFAGCSRSSDGQFHDPKVLQVSGRAFPVDVVYSDVGAVDDYITETVVKAVEIHDKEPPGDILAFLTSPIETEQACKRLRNHPQFNDNVLPLELHGRLQIEDQQEAFSSAPAGKRKIIFATNCAETSITIPGIKYVIDSGKVREVSYDSKRNISQLSVQWVTRSSAEQRKGRAGRTDCGKCYRLYSEDQYNEMLAESVPEILRVHLGQALLKLMMLGVADVATFDFVQAPDKDAIVNAENVLRELEAFDDDGITETGKKLTKLSLEPRLGKVALQGIVEKIPFESVVMAAVSTVGGSIFFRVGSEEQKQLADRKKTKFCDEWGDIITLVNVYREWDSLPLARRNAWCKENSINAKSMRTAKSTVAEIDYTFKHELKIHIPQKFSDGDDTNEKMAKILLDCYPSNVSRYCGHRQEGYCVASSPDVKLQVHPSAALNYIEEWPQWVVYERVLTTTRTFMLNVTTVKDSWVTEKIQNGTVRFRMDQLNEFVVHSHPTLFVGSRFVGALLGNKAQLKKELEFILNWNGPTSRTVIDIDKTEGCFGGIVRVYTTDCIRQLAADMIHSELSRSTRTVMSQIKEEPLLPQSSIRFILDRGAVIRTIMMPHESRTVKIGRVESGSDTNTVVMTRMSAFGEIESVDVSNDSNDSWGLVHFKLPEQAAAAVSAKTKLSHHFDINLQVCSPVREERARPDSNFTVKVSAPRRPLLGVAYVTFPDFNDVLEAVCAGSCEIVKSQNGHHLTAHINIQENRKSTEQCFLKNIPQWADVDVIRTGLRRRLNDVRILNIVLPRAKPPSQLASDHLHNLFQTKINECLHTDDFLMVSPPPRSEKDFDMRAFLKFTDPHKARQAAKILSRVDFEQCPMSASVELKVSFVVPKPVYKFSKQSVDRTKEELNTQAEGEIQISCQEHRNKRDMMFELEATSLNDLVLAKYRLDSVLNGHAVQLDALQLRYLKSAAGQEVIKLFEHETQTVVRVDDRRGTAYIHGHRDHIEHATDRLTNDLKAASCQTKKSITLSSSCYPRGMMRAVITKFGPDLEKLRAECGATSLELVIRRHVVTCYGDSNACDVFCRAIDDVAQSLPSGDRVGSDSDCLPECPVCLTEVEKDSFYVAEYCRHVYCKTCVEDLVKNALKNNDIPIRCAANECDKEFVLQDLYNLYGRNFTPIYETAIRSFMQKRSTEFRFCSTPGCLMIYRKALVGEQGRKFFCTECQTSLCTSCDVAFHDGFTCDVFQSFKDIDGVLAKWLKENPGKRILCPKCRIGIEKNEGCNHMQCTACRIHFCWICKETFDESGPCYAHISAQQHN